MSDVDFTIAVFPFLKTSAPVAIGRHTFRSTVDVDGLPPHQREAVSEVADMLFVQNELRVKSASYAVVLGLETQSNDPRIIELERLRDVVAYFYASPHEVFENVFLSPEEISLVLFTPARVSIFLTRPEHHTVPIMPTSERKTYSSRHVDGYNGLYNFRHPFWVEPGARLYGPKPHMTLNISQDLFLDIEHGSSARPDYNLLRGLLDKPNTRASLRIYSALHWFNFANERGLDQSQALLNLLKRFCSYPKTQKPNVWWTLSPYCSDGPND